MPCQKTLLTESSMGYLANWRGEILPATSRSATAHDVISTETESSTPTIPIIPIVIARPCQNVRDIVPQILFNARSSTEKTHDPAQSTTMTQVIIIPVPTEERDRTVSRRKLLDPGYTSAACPSISAPAGIWLLIASINSSAGNNAISPK